MAKSANQKLKLLYLSQYLLRSSDEQHPVTVAQMIEYLAARGISAERKSIYDDMEALRLFGLDVQTTREKSSTGYFIGQREFQLPELKLLVDSIQSSKFLTQKKSLELIGKLEGLASEHEARQLHRQVYVRGRIKTMNESIYYIVDELQAAMEADKAISFQYYEWNVERQRVFRHNGKRYQVSPWALMWDDENYYLVSFDHESQQLKHFRVDKMSGIARADASRQGADVFEKYDISAYSDSHFGMFSGEVRQVRLRFENYLAGAVIDRFGTETALIPLDETHFSVTINTAVNMKFFGWLCGFGNEVRILSPDSVAMEMHIHLASIAKLYQH